MEKLEFSKLKPSEINREYLDILSQLSPNDDLSLLSIEEARKSHLMQIHRGRTNYILTKDGELIGLGSIIFDYRIPYFPRPSAHVEDIAIKKDLHGFGYGRYLMDKIKEEAHKKNAYKIILSCADYNIAFYKKCGFIHTSATMRYDFDEDLYEDM